VVRPFTYERPGDARAAVDLVTADPEATFLAGGTNLVDHLRLGVATPHMLVDVTSLTSEVIEDRGGGLWIGAAARNSDVAAHPDVRERYPLLAQALLAGASGQLRNMATTGGNLMQRTRCVYFQDVTTPCNKRTPGTGCSAIGGYTRHHAILGASEHCVATHPSDMGVAMTALDAQVRVLGRDGERLVPITELYRLPGDDPSRDTTLAHGELILGVEVPDVPAARRSRYRKVRDRASYAFALVSVAAALDLADGEVRDARIAFGGVAHAPWRAWAAEDVLRDGPASMAAFAAAADASIVAAEGVPGLDGGNAFKIPLMHRTLVAVLRDLAAQEA
jgi:xanthine dehydrogenase YagS FAD-binding subunit